MRISDCSSDVCSSDLTIAAIRDDTATLDVRLNAALDDALVPLVAGIPHQGDRTAAPTVSLWVDRERARHSAWYESFPRSERSDDRRVGKERVRTCISRCPPYH